MAVDLEKETSRVGLKTNGNKSKVLNTIGHRTLSTRTNEYNIEDIDQFAFISICTELYGIHYPDE